MMNKIVTRIEFGENQHTFSKLMKIFIFQNNFSTFHKHNSMRNPKIDTFLLTENAL